MNAARTLCLFVLVVLSGCAQVLGIDEAHVDPSLTGAAGNSAEGAAELTRDAGDTGGSLCARYCDAITLSCADVHAQYVSEAACLASCPDFPEGTPGDTDGNTINCRLGYALEASADPYTYCTWAGPGGDGHCGNNCQGFCTLMMNACTPESTGDAADYFANEIDCETACEAIPDIGNYSATDTTQQQGSDQVQCRLYYADAAIAANDPKAHCPRAMGLDACVEPQP